MKYAIVLPDGAADEPVDQLDGRTPLEVACIPNIDWISTNGRQGCVVTVPDGFAPGSDVATLSLLGYDPRHDYDGRAPLEAAARGVDTSGDELIFRCNFVTIIDGIMEDFTAGHIAQAEADRLVTDLNEHFHGERWRFHAGVSYRNLAVMADAGRIRPRCTPPHDIPGQPIKSHLPRGPGAAQVKDIMRRAADLLEQHEVNTVRRDLGENEATDIWLWGQGRPRALPSFQSRFGVRGVAIAAVDLIRGIARNAGMELLDVSGATGYLDTNYEGKGEAAAAALDAYDLVVVHIEAPDEAGHLGDPEAKIVAIERIDEHVVGPLLEKLRTFEAWRILVAPDHPTPVHSRIHTATPPPFCLAGKAFHALSSRPFSEASAAKSDLHIDPGHELMEFFLKS